MFRMVFLSIIRSLRLYILVHHQLCVIQVLWLLANKLMMDGETVRKMYSVVPK